MNKKDIKKIILEEIEDALKGMEEHQRPGASPEELAADSRPEEDDDVWDKMDGEMYDDAGDPLDEQSDAYFNKENDFKRLVAAAKQLIDGGASHEEVLAKYGLHVTDAAEGSVNEMARTSNIFKLSQEASLKDILQFMQRVNDVLKTYKSPGQKRPKKRFTPEEMKALATAMLNPEGFTSKDVIAATSYTSPAQANKFLAALEQKGLITITSVLKKSLVPDRDPNAPETRGRKAQSAEFDIADDPTGMDFSDFDNLDLSDPTSLYENQNENNTNMSDNLTNYIKKVINEAKNPLAAKLKEVEAQGKIASLESKLAAIQEMIEETNGRLTRIDEDNEFSEMMDKKAVKEVRKQLKELERAEAKLQKEYDKVSGGRKKETVVDEDMPITNDEIAEDSLDSAIDEVELEEDDLRFEGLNSVHDLKPMVTMNESTLRMQKLAGLITESDIKKKTKS